MQILFEKWSDLFLDLEGTVIKDLTDPVFLPEIIDTSWFKTALTHAFQVNIFSWAIVSQADLKANQWLIDAVADRLGMKINQVVLRDDFLPFFRSRFGAIDHIEFEELCRSLGKATVFEMFIREKCKGRHNTFTLIDDMVEDSVLKVNNLTIQSISAINRSTIKWRGRT